MDTATEQDPRIVYAGAVLASVTARCPRDCRHVDVPDRFCDQGCPATVAECWSRLIQWQGGGLDGAAAEG